MELTTEIPTRGELGELYGSVGWLAYTNDPASLEEGVRNSTFVVVAREEGQLIGLARVVSDDRSIMYLQDILVRPEQQGQGVGRALAERCLERFAHVRQKVLMTDDEPRRHRFYESLGYQDVADIAGLHAFVRHTATE